MSGIGTGSGLSSEIRFFRLSCLAHKIIFLSRHSLKFMRDSNPRPPGPEPGAPQPELMNLKKIAACVFAMEVQPRTHRDLNPARLHLNSVVALSGELVAGAVSQSTVD